jgi:hypothetical protein
MVIAFWVVLIHVIELAIVGAFLLIRRNNALEAAVIKQQEYLDAISIIVANSDAKLKELDRLGAFEADDEVGTFFTNLREIQNMISEFNSSIKN